MQAAAPTALPTAETKAATPSAKGKASAKASLGGIPLPGTKASSRTGSTQPSKTTTRADKRFTMLAALEKALAAVAQGGRAAGTAGSVHGTAGAAHAALSGEAGAAQALLAAAEEKNDKAGGHVEETAEARKASGKKTTSALGGFASAQNIALALARELLKALEGQGPVQKDAQAQSPDSKAASIQVAAQKHADPKLHVVDARRKPAEKPPDGTLFDVKQQRPAQPVLDASVPLTHKAQVERDDAVLEPRKPQPQAPSQAPNTIERIREMAGSELLRATGIIVRDGGGEIKLVLKPESLGSVRIRMNLVDNRIEGRIIVDNPMVKQAFDGTINSLTRALTAEGFQAASLQVSVGGQNADTGRQEREEPQRVRRVSAESFERSVPGVESVSLGDMLVNLFV